MAGDFVVRPVGRKKARELCADHPHAGTLPNSSKYYMVLSINGREAGLAVWGYGFRPTGTPNKLFGESGRVEDYLELCRFFVYDWCPPNTASRFLATTHRLLKRYTDVKWLYTYAAGFQGLIGTIYQAANYDYIGRHLCDTFYYIPGTGLVHAIAVWHRYGNIGPPIDKNLVKLRKFVPEVYRWCGWNFRYIYWLCSKRERRRLLAASSFEILPYPSTEDLEIWLEDERGVVRSVSPEEAKQVPIVKLRTSRKGR
jgi:hypothetical protein